MILRIQRVADMVEKTADGKTNIEAIIAFKSRCIKIVAKQLKHNAINMYKKLSWCSIFENVEGPRKGCLTMMSVSVTRSKTEA